MLESVVHCSTAYEMFEPGAPRPDFQKSYYYEPGKEPLLAVEGQSAAEHSNSSAQ